VLKGCIEVVVADETVVEAVLEVVAATGDAEELVVCSGAPPLSCLLESP
jgi:hypothetical protein